MYSQTRRSAHGCAKFADLELRLRERYIAKGRVARDLQMPPDYDMFGVYKISIKRRSTKTGIVIIRRATKTEKELPAKSTKAFKNQQALFIEKNYSTMSATLREQGSLVTFPLMTLFMDALELGGLDPDVPPDDGDDDDDDGGDNGADDQEGKDGAQDDPAPAEPPAAAAAASSAGDVTANTAAEVTGELSFKPQLVT